MQTDPIYSVVPTDVFKLRANDYNPNVVFNKELKLLEESILLNGWIHPIIINTDNLIIDGFHRVHLAKTSQKLQDRDDGLVPCVILDLSDKEAMMLTVRINRAKGTHTAMRMSDLVQTLVNDYGVTPEEMIQKMGMTDGEINLLYDGSLLKKHKLQDHKYSKAWTPVETRLLPPEERKLYEKKKPEEEEFERDEDA